MDRGRLIVSEEWRRGSEFEVSTKIRTALSDAFIWPPDEITTSPLGFTTARSISLYRTITLPASSREQLWN